MGCEQYRELLSASLDGEATIAERTAADEHLSDCAECRAWMEAVTTITRLARMGTANVAPGVPDSVLDAAPGPGRARIAQALRVLLTVIGACQLLLGLVQVTGFATGTVLHDGHLLGGTNADHLWHESAAWNVAIGAGFLWLALRRVRPIGLLPILTAFVTMLVLLSANDIAAERVDTGRLLSHALIITGYAIIVALSRPSLDFSDPPSTRAPHPRWSARFDTEDQPDVSVMIRPAHGTAHYRRAA